MSTIAWHGRVMMHEAKWTDKEGSTVTFRLPMDPQAERMRNPFQSFTKRRKGRAGTRFMMACHRLVEHGKHADRVAVYEDEVMLAGWNDSQSTGHTVKFWLCGDILGHPFEGMDRKLDHFVISLVELDDDEEPIDQKMRERVEEGAKPVTGRTSYVAAMLCKNEHFWEWINGPAGGSLAGNPIIDEESAKLWIYMICNIKSRASLDDPEREDAQRRFQSIRTDFLEWDGAPPF